MVTIEELEAIAGGVYDPELPPLTLADLGILRSVEQVDDTVVVTVTPTYSGCPAVEYIEDQLRTELVNAGCDNVRIVRAFSPSWTTDWITDEGRRKLTEAGIAPPRPLPSPEVQHRTLQSDPADGTAVTVNLRRLARTPVPCPRCGGTDTTEISHFGSTACKSLHRCADCSEPFDHFKEI